MTEHSTNSLTTFKIELIIILDDFGLVPFDNNLRLALLQILEDRYGKSSTIIASQLPIKNWYDYFKRPYHGRCNFEPAYCQTSQN
ncbi:MAG: ATP-binding protein [Saprospiraceae bacterium]|nr:ATP-binding protein [Saprospiraceae bacterium]